MLNSILNESNSWMSDWNMPTSRASKACWDWCTCNILWRFDNICRGYGNFPLIFIHFLTFYVHVHKILKKWRLNRHNFSKHRSMLLKFCIYISLSNLNYFVTIQYSKFSKAKKICEKTHFYTFFWGAVTLNRFLECSIRYFWN